MPLPPQLPRHHSETLRHSSNSRYPEAMARSTGIPQRLRNDASESWVEISSQPSSSSLSSIDNEIVTTGLRVQHNPNSRRRRRQQPMHSLLSTTQDRPHAGSSQEEYDETESEEDPVLSSSTEHILPLAPPSRLAQAYTADSESESDGDENGTALGRRTADSRQVFTPQPNAFSHPPSSQAAGVPGSYFPRSQASAPRPSFTSRSIARTQHASYREDQDAALRASLTTLLSIGAAAARGLPKRNGPGNAMATEPMGLRLVPEAEMLGSPPSNAPNSSRPLTPSTRAVSISSQDAPAQVAEKGKRKAAGAKDRMAKKKRVQLVEEAMISPTLLTWMMSAGVVVLVSVVGFGAGYVIGREVGRGELAGLGVEGSCGKEVVRSSTGTLRRFRWGGMARSVVA